MPVEFAVAIFIFIALTDVAASIALTRLSRRFPHVQALRERRNISFAITAEIIVIVFLAVWARTQDTELPPEVRTNLLILALSLPSWINLIWFIRLVIRRVHPPPPIMAIDPDTFRSELRHAIANTITVDIAALYRKHPEWLADERSNENIEALRDSLGRVAKLLDNYDIRPKL